MEACVAVDANVVGAFVLGLDGGLGCWLGWLVGLDGEIHQYLANGLGVVLWMWKGWL